MRKLGSQGAEQEGVERSRRLRITVEALVDRGVGFMCEKGQSPKGNGKMRKEGPTFLK